MAWFLGLYPNDPRFYPNDPRLYPNDPRLYPNDPRPYPNDPRPPVHHIAQKSLSAMDRADGASACTTVARGKGADFDIVVFRERGAQRGGGEEGSRVKSGGG